jgi:hypothetical protein
MGASPSREGRQKSGDRAVADFAFVECIATLAWKRTWLSLAGKAHALGKVMGSIVEQQSDSLTPEKLQLFVAGLSGLAPEEVRKAKILYIRNAISEYRAMRASIEGFRTAQGCFSIIPIFWPIIGAQKRMAAAQLELARERIRNAIDVWRMDLRGERFNLDDEEITP